MIGMRVEKTEELVVLEIIHAPQRYRPRPRNNDKRQPRIGLMRPVVDAGKHLPYLIGGNKGALLDGFARP